MTAKNIWRLTLAGGACVALLAGCSWIKNWPGSSSSQTLASEPQAKVMQTADATWMEPTNKTQAVSHMVPDQSQGNKDAMARLDRLERQVAQMQNDMNTMMPVLSRLVAVQTDIQGMLTRLNAGQPVASAPVAAPVPAPVAAAAAPASAPDPVATQPPMAMQPQTAATIPAPAPAPAATAAPAPMTPAVTPPAVTLDAVRVGEHPGKTRIVIDASDKLPFSQSIDPVSHVLTIDVPGTAWNGGTAQQATPKSPLLSSWQAEPDGQGGTRIVAQLRKPSKIVLAESIAPGGNARGRIVVDLAAQ